MSPRLRVLAITLLAVAVVVGAVALTGGFGIGLDAGPTASASAPGAVEGSPGPGTDPSAGVPPIPTLEPTPTPRPALGGTELYGYLPYWQMNSTMATYLGSTPLTTVALFSVSARRSGAIHTGTTGYRRITGDIGRRLIADAHARGVGVELVFTSFGAEKNAIFFGRVVPVASPSLGPDGSPPGSPEASAATPPAGPTPLPVPTPIPSPKAPPWHRTVDELVELAFELGVDGINVDVELLDAEDRPAYGEFLSALRAALIDANPGARLTVATEAGQRGVGNAAVAAAAGVDRLFLMGYDYHWSGSMPGASSPVDRTDGLYTLRWSIDHYVEAGVPRDRILLGLPLYGMQWRTTGPHRVYPVVGTGVTWIPSQHRDLLLDRAFQPSRDRYEQVEWFAVPSRGNWLLTFFDSPMTLRPKLALALDNGLAGAGFWAMGYERGLPGYLDLMRAFRAGEISREESPPRP